AVERALRRGRTWAGCGPCWQYPTNTGNVPSLLTPSSQAIDLIISASKRPRSLSRYDHALCPVLPILSGSGNVLWIIPKLNILIPLFRRNGLRTCSPDLLHIVSPGLGVYNPMLGLESSLVGIVRFLQVLLDADFDLCPVGETRLRELMSSPGAPSTPSYSAGPSTPPSYSSGPSTPPIYSPGPSMPTNYSLGSSRNAECSNCKYLRRKISVLKAKIDMHMHPEQHTVNSAALLYEVLNEMEKLDLE
ncbi:hypothetical protein Tco_1251540, partial [Tanacetum coccineum]